MEQQKIIAKIDVKRMRITYDVQGMRGTACKDITDLLAQGGELISEDKKPEFEEELTSELVNE